IFISVDVISILLNPVFHHFYSINQILLDEGYLYSSLVSSPFHKIHLLFSYLLVLLSFIIFIHKIFIVNKFYRVKYIIILFSMAVVAVWEAFYILSNTPIDLSMISYAISGCLIYYFSVEYVPFYLRNRIMSDVITDSSSAMLFMDAMDHCIFINNVAADLFSISIDDYELAKEKFFSLFKDDSIFKGDKFILHDYNPNGTDLYFDIKCDKVFDRHNDYIGFYASLEDRTSVVQKNQREQYLASHDSLTGFYTRDFFFHEVEKRLNAEKDTAYLVIGIDMKDFKMVNSIFGKYSGDDILREMASIIKRILDKYALYGRIYGDRFGILLRKKDYKEDIFRESFSNLIHKEGNEQFPIITFIGVYEVSDRTLAASVMFDRAFLTIASIKNDVKKRISYYDDNLKNSRLWEQKVIFSMETAIALGQLKPYLQPQVDHNGKLLGAEVLVRWQHPEEGLIPPSKFINILEKNGLVVKLDYYMWEQTCIILKKWHDAGHTDLHLSVNISPKDFYFIDVHEAIVNLAEKYSIPHESLRLEITETVVMSDFDRKLPVIQRLRNDGFIIEMDDFGSGYSSLNMLKDMPVDILKLDMVFMQQTENTERVRTILRFLIDMAIHLNIDVIAEGVEIEDHVNFLYDCGCNIFQGYYFSRPIPLSDFENVYHEIFS
ncbi:MAG: bifunctional diguanylate cyclase/phosphodiesterase, partial [Treponema sp.]|nr:bifunctional diguanylate cyclase/phosphodiesterase [Treponema sp.]